MSPVTNYSPLIEAREAVGNTITIDDMIDQGYDDFDVPEDPSTNYIQRQLASALLELDGQIFDDTAKWAAVNDIVAAMLAIDRAIGTETRIHLNDTEITEDVDWQDEPFTYEVTEVGAEVVAKPRDHH